MWRGLLAVISARERRTQTLSLNCFAEPHNLGCQNHFKKTYTQSNKEAACAIHYLIINTYKTTLNNIALHILHSSLTKREKKKIKVTIV
jgi:hypothetical protein